MRLDSKGLTLITVNPSWKSIVDDEIVKQHPGCRPSSLVLCGDGLCIA